MTQRNTSEAAQARYVATGELSDNDLEQVVGGLTRAWDMEPRPVTAPPVPTLSVSLLSAVESAQRISA